MRRLLVAALLLCLPMVGEGHSIKHHPAGGSVPSGDDTVALGDSTHRFQSLYVSRGLWGGVQKALTAGAATPLFRVSLPASSWVVLRLRSTTFCTDGTDFSLRGYDCRFTCVNKAGTESCSAAVCGSNADVATGGASLTTHSLAADTAPANAIDFSLTAACSLVETTLDSYWSVEVMPSTIVVTAN